MDKSNVTQLHPKDKDSSKEEFLGSSLSPREIVSELDRFVVGQNKAKRAVAVALRNRWRRQALKGEMKNEVLPKNLLKLHLKFVFLQIIISKLKKYNGKIKRNTTKT